MNGTHRPLCVLSERVSEMAHGSIRRVGPAVATHMRGVPESAMIQAVADATDNGYVLASRDRQFNSVTLRKFTENTARSLVIIPEQTNVASIQDGEGPRLDAAGRYIQRLFK